MTQGCDRSSPNPMHMHRPPACEPPPKPADRPKVLAGARRQSRPSSSTRQIMCAGALNRPLNYRGCLELWGLCWVSGLSFGAPARYSGRAAWSLRAHDASPAISWQGGGAPFVSTSNPKAHERKRGVVGGRRRAARANHPPRGSRGAEIASRAGKPRSRPAETCWGLPPLGRLQLAPDVERLGGCNRQQRRAVRYLSRTHEGVCVD